MVPLARSLSHARALDPPALRRLVRSPPWFAAPASRNSACHSVSKPKERRRPGYQGLARLRTGRLPTAPKGLNAVHVPLVDLRGEYELLREEILAAVDQVLSGMQLYLGPQTEALEAEWATYCGTDHAVAVASGTDALLLALIAADVGPGDEVITVGWTFMATLEAIIHAGARPRVVDVREDTLTIDVEKLADAISPRTRAIIPVHIYGHPADMDEIMELAAEHDIFVLEDAAQAHGAEYRGRKVGSLGHAAAFSFYVTKNLGAYGEGGMVTTNDDAIAHKLRLLRNHGRAGKADHVAVGYNSRMHELQAAILRLKLRHLPAWNERRRQIAATYGERLANLPLRLPTELPHCRHAWHIYGTRLPDRQRLIAALDRAGIGYALHYRLPAHKQPAMTPWALDKAPTPVTDEAATQILGLPIHPLLSDEQIDYVCQVVRTALE